MKFRHTAVALGVIVLVGGGATLWSFSATPDRADAGKIGGPVRGLTEQQLKWFDEGKQLFVKDFTPHEGLGPLFNGKSCYECHGKPGVAGTESELFEISNVTKIAKRRPRSVWAKKSFDEAIQGVYRIDVDPLEYEGGLALASRSISDEYPKDFGQFRLGSAKVPNDAEFVSVRHAPPLLGLGLIGAVPGETLKRMAEEQKISTGAPMGRFLASVNIFEREQKGMRFGWKAPHASVISFTLEALNGEMGITTPFQPVAKSASLPGHFPHRMLDMLPKDPNDPGQTAVKIGFYLNTLAAPPRGQITAQAAQGEKVFGKLGCAVCHVAEYKTADRVWLVDPDTDVVKLSARLKKCAASPGMQLAGDDTKYVEVKALENQTIHPYSDLLIHKMGRKLADGVPEGSAGGDYWRTTPLWGLRLKKHYLHDGRTTNLQTAILEHGGQADKAVAAYNSCSQAEKQALLAFLRSL